MKKMFWSVVVLFPLFLVSCVTSQDSTMKQTNISVNEAPLVAEQQNEQSPLIIDHQTEDYVWHWVHEEKARDDYEYDAIDCRPTQKVLDTYLSDAEKTFYLPNMIPKAAFNKCMIQRGWTIERSKRDSEVP